MSDNKKVIASAIERKVDEYRQKFFSPTPATLARWRRDEQRRSNAKNQLRLPLEFDDDPPVQMSIFDEGESSSAAASEIELLV